MTLTLKEYDSLLSCQKKKNSVYFNMSREQGLWNYVLLTKVDCKIMDERWPRKVSIIVSCGTHQTRIQNEIA
jgi:hypothetical protein